MSNGRRPADDERYERGLDDYHDPTAGFGGVPPARSALTLRLWLATFGVVLFATVTVIAAIAGIGWLIVIGAVLAAIALANLAWVAHRKRRGEPG
jgi:Family of unknown function (DUF6343)